MLTGGTESIRAGGLDLVEVGSLGVVLFVIGWRAICRLGRIGAAVGAKEERDRKEKKNP